MQGIVFEYDPVRSKQNRQFTIRLTQRRKENELWVKHGPNVVYRASDLPKIRANIIDSSLFKIALESEMEFRRLEGRSLSPEHEFTILRIALHNLDTFISGSCKKQILCDHQGHPLSFSYDRGLVLEIRADKKDDYVLLNACLGDVESSGLDYLIRAKHVAGVLNSRILALHHNIPFSFFKSLPLNERIDSLALDGIAQSLNKYGSSVRLKAQGKGKSKVIRNSDCRPLLEIDPTFAGADLSFIYPDHIVVASGETRDVIFDFQRGIELHRNKKREQDHIAFLSDSGARYRESTRGNWFLPTGKLDRLLHRLSENGFVLQVNHRPLRLDIQHSWQTKTQNQQIRISAKITGDQGEADSGALFDAFHRRRRHLNLSDGSCGYISSGLMDEISKFSSKGTFEKEQIVFNDFDFPVVSDLLGSAGDSETDVGFEKLLEFGKDASQLEPSPVPDTLKGILRPYQQHGFDWLIGLNQTGFNGILADDMGLGKTLQVLALLLSLKRRSRSGTSLIVVPKTLIHNWEIEIKRFAPSLDYMLHTGSGRIRDSIGFEEQDLVITSYGLIRQDFELLREIQWSYLILDEAQVIKNPAAKITRAVKRLSSRHRLSISGTPVENAPLDLWSHFDFLMPGMLSDAQGFKQRYHQDHPEDLRELRLRTRPFVLRRMKNQVCQELPPKTEITLYCPFTEEQKAIYDTMLNTAQREIVEQEEREANLSIHLLTLLLRLRQIACDPALAVNDDTETSPISSISGKHEMVLETAEAILSQGHKILIFSQFVGHLKRIKEGFDRRGIKSFYLDGSTTDRKEEIHRFQIHATPCVFFISLKAGGLGLNLTEADYAFLLDPWWNPAVENQAIDRCYRIGQENPVTVYRFITENSIEEKVMALKQIKQDIQDIVIQESDMEDTHLTREELQQLLFDD